MSEIKSCVSQENDELLDYNVDQTVITNKKYLSRISSLDLGPLASDTCDASRINDYPKPYIFYPYTENVTIEKRFVTIKSLPTTTIICENTQLAKVHHLDPYDENDAEVQFLTSTPVSFFVVSKPNIGETELARNLADLWKCVYISPESVIREEIVSGTRAGKCINFNLKCGRGIGPDVILRLVERRVKSETAKHRGFVISGFPLIPNDMYKPDPLSSESAIFNAEEIFEEVFPVDVTSEHPDTVSTIKGSKVSLDVEKTDAEDIVDEEVKDEGVKEDIAKDQFEEEEEKEAEKKPKSKFEEKKQDVDLGPEIENVVKNTESFQALSTLEGQINFLMNLFNKPLVFVYIFCGNLDVVNKREQYRYNVFSECEISLRKEHADTAFSPDLPRSPDESEDDSVESNDLKQLVLLPVNFNESISAQLRAYSYEVHPVIDKMVLSGESQYFIKLDGRLPISRMFSNLRLRLKILGFQPVLVPEKLADEEIEGEGMVEEVQMLMEDKLPEEAYETLRIKHIVNRMFKWQLSNWGYKCPVAIKQGRVIKGQAKNAVRFMNKIFFLSDDSAMLNFCRNPRPYLLPITPQLTCRFYVMGPNFCGKTSVSQCLAYLFNCQLLDPVCLETQYRKKKEAEFIETIKTAAINEGLMVLAKQREKSRKDKINWWLDRATDALERVKNNMNSEEDCVIRPAESTYIVHTSDSEVSLKLHMILPESNLNLVRNLLQDPSKLLLYLPSKYNEDIPPPTVFDPFINEYVEDVIKNTPMEDTSLSLEEKIDMYRTAIKNAEQNSFSDRSGGWIIDGMPPDMELLKEFDSDMLADDIICLKDEDPENIFLLAKIARKDYNSQFTEFRKFFNRLKRFSAADRVPESLSKPTRASTLFFIDQMIQEMENNAVRVVDGDASDIELVRTKKNQAYAEHLTEFNERWANVKDFFSSYCCDPPVEINIANKSIPQLLRSAIVHIENKYRRIASVVTEDEKVQEITDFGAGAEHLDEEEEVGEGGDSSGDTFQENRRYGNTYEYCPVVLQRYFILWKGREELSVRFEDKIYFLSSEDALIEFVEDPRRYLTSNPRDNFPPPRICVIGPTGSGKTVLCKALAKNFGLHYVNFEQIILEIFDLDDKKSFEETIKNASSDSTNVVHPIEIELIRKFLEEDISFPNNVLKRALHPLWYHHIYQNVGFVLDDFPIKVTDVDFMTSLFLIPDVVIELHATPKQIYDRLYHVRLNIWQEELDEKKRLQDIENGLVLSKWQESREQRVKELAQKIRNEKKLEAFHSHTPNVPYSTPVDSNVSLRDVNENDEEIEIDMFIYDPEQENEDLEAIKAEINKEFPEPVFDDKWETVEEATVRIATELEEMYEREIQSQDSLKEQLKLSNIEFSPFDSDKSIYKVFLDVSKFAEKYKFKNQSFFERTYNITVDIAEKLLEQGYYFMSKFGRTCPVQIYENVNPLQMYLYAEYKMTLFPVIHRRYIYFICGYENLIKFKQNPLLYTKNVDYRLPLFPLKIAIIGPPKSGKSILAERFQRDFGLKIITRGTAARYVLKYLGTSELAQNMREVLDKGWSLTYEMIAQAVEALTLDGKCLCQGYVLDGFPCCVIEMKHLRNLGIVPYLYLDILADSNKIEECTLSESARKMFPPFGISNFNELKIHRWNFQFIKIRYTKWQKESHSLRAWLNKEYQNVYPIPTPDTKWHVWIQAKQYSIDVMYKIVDYYKNCNLDQVFKLRNLLLSPYEFLERQSVFLNYCPCCWTNKKYLISGGYPPDRSGVVQFREFCYWICEEHMDVFIKHNELFLPPFNKNILTPYLPVIANGDKCEEPYQDGFCIVSFWDSQPDRQRPLEQGEQKYTVLYREQYYQFCCEECLEKFMKEPHVYYDKVINFRDPNPLDICKTLPTLGYLEQYAANLLIRAIVNTEISRPVHPCMDIAKSAAMNIALYLKINNLNSNKDLLPLHEEFRKKFTERREKIKELIEYFKSRMNPFLELDDLIDSYPECPGDVKSSEPSVVPSLVSAVEKLQLRRSSHTVSTVDKSETAEYSEYSDRDVSGDSFEEEKYEYEG